MSKQIQQVETLEEFLSESKDILSVLWHKQLDSEGQSLVQAIYQRFVTLANAVDEKERLLLSVQAGLQEMERQRDIAITEVKLQQRNGKQLAKRRLASEIAIANDIPEHFPDILRVLSVLIGDQATNEEYLLTELMEAFTALGHVLFEEQVFQEAISEDE